MTFSTKQASHRRQNLTVPERHHQVVREMLTDMQIEESRYLHYLLGPARIHSLAILDQLLQEPDLCITWGELWDRVLPVLGMGLLRNYFDAAIKALQELIDQRCADLDGISFSQRDNLP